MTAPTLDSAAKLGEDLLVSWVSTGGLPRIPAGRRDEVVATLTACMVHDAILAAYTNALKAGWKMNRARAPMAGYPSGDIAEQLIVRQGFSELGDNALADVAVDPAAVLALHETLNLPPATVEAFIEPGEWFLQAFRHARESERVGPTDQGVVVTPVKGMVADGVRNAPHPSAPRAGTRRSRWLSVVPWAVAAAALIGAFVVWQMGRKSGPVGSDHEVLMARAAPKRVEPKGANTSVTFDLELESERDGFATVVVLPLEKSPMVYPDYGRDEPRVGPATQGIVGPIEAPVGSSVITVVTETPATDLVRRVIIGMDKKQGSPVQVRDSIRERLFASGHRWAAFGITTVNLPKP